MISEQLAELVRRHASSSQDAAYGALEKISAAMYRYSDSTSVRVAHDVMATVDPRDNEASALERLYDLRSRDGRDAAWHKAGSYQKSGNAECQSQLVWYPDLFDQQLQTRAQVSNGCLSRGPLAERGDARAKLGRGRPTAVVLILLNDVGHVHVTSHIASIACIACSGDYQQYQTRSDLER
jgi:hypothetical protein